MKPASSGWRTAFSRALTRRGKITIRIDGAPLGVPKRITVKRALELADATFGAFPGDSARARLDQELNTHEKLFYLLFLYRY